MRAIILKDFGGTDQLVYDEIPEPTIGTDEVLIQVYAVGINPVDIKTRKGKGQAARLKVDPPMILGWDVSGTVVHAGENSPFRKGDEVFGMIRIPGHGKAYAEYVSAPSSHLARKPSSISHEEAAATPLAAMTAWQAIVHQAKLQSGQRILVQAAAGGVGHFAVQIARHLGAYVIGSSSKEKREFVLSLGAHEHVDYKAGPLENQIKSVDVVIDAIGGDNIPRSLAVLKEGGTIVSLPSGVSETVSDQAQAQGKNGIFFFVHSDANDMQQIASLLESGTVKPHIEKIFSFDQIKAAHDHVEAGRTIGKIVVKVRGER